MRVTLTVLLASSLAAAAAPALQAPQTSSAAVAETARVVVIEIPVHVVDKNGEPVRGLTAGDFELTDDGRKVEISGLEVIDLNRAVPAAPAPGAKDPFAEAPPPAARRHWLLVFDFSYSSMNGLLRARDGARAFVKTGMKENDLAAVATFSVDTGWKLLVNFTRDRSQLDRAVETLGFPSTGSRTTDPLAFAIFQPMAGGTSAPSAAQSETDAVVRENLQDAQRMAQTASDDRARGRVAQLLESFGRMARALDAVRGRKHVLFFSEGFESRLLAGNAGDIASPLEQSSPTQDTAAEASVSGEIWKIDSDSRFGSSATRGRLAAAFDLFGRSDAVLHTVDISGLRAEGDVADRAGSGKDALFSMASQTGGEFIRNANQLGGELQRVVERTGLTYLLVYQPKKLSAPGQFHKLRVRVNTPGARVSARSGYYEPRPFRALTPIERLLATGDLITGGSAGNDIPARLLVAPFAAEAGVSQVPVILEIPGPALLAGDTGDRTGVQIYAYANDPEGKLADYVTQDVGLDLGKARSSIESGGIKFYGTLFLAPGDYTVRALVRNATTGRSGLQTALVRVPAIPGGPAVVLPPLFQEAPGRWVMTKAAPRPDAAARAPDYPFAVAGESFIPAALPALGNGTETRVAVFTYNFGGTEKDALQVRSEIVSADGSTRPVELKLARDSAGERGGGRKLLFTFKPEGLSPGRYALKVAVAGPAGKSAEQAAPFEVK
jgi:VWFA-related protein